MAEDKGFEVIDKRRVSADSPPPAEAESAEASAASVTPEGENSAAETEEASGAAEESGPEPARGEKEEFPPGAGGPLPEMDAVGLISVCVNMLHEIAWVKLGFVPSPVTQKIEKDLTQARLAIDCAADLARHLESHVDAETKRDLQNLISTLRMNFVQQSQR